MGGRASRMEVQKGKLNHPTVIRGIWAFLSCAMQWSFKVKVEVKEEPSEGIGQPSLAAEVATGQLFSFGQTGTSPMYDLFAET